jgi:Fe-S-cluster containining protein
MSDDKQIDWAAEFADDEDFLAIPEEKRGRVLEMLAAFEKTLERGVAAIYGDEAEDEADADVACDRHLASCGARCCTLMFALTPAEVELGRVQFNRDRPYFIARDPDGLCPHLDRQSLQCQVWQDRPLRCRRYDCCDNRDIWPEGRPG